MLTVPEVARRVGKHPETVRRWIREGKLPATKIGTQHVIDENDLALVGDLPPAHRPRQAADAMPDVVATLRRSRAERSARIRQAVAAYGSGFPEPAYQPERGDLWLPAIVGRIVRLVDPVRIVLFGSRAHSDAREDSDYDLLIILDEIRDRRETRVSLYRALADLPIGKDIVLATPQEAGWAPTMIGDVLRTAVTGGRTIYERAEPS